MKETGTTPTRLTEENKSINWLFVMPFIVIGVYTLVSLLCFGAGFEDAVKRYDKHSLKYSDCASEPSRLANLVPTYKLGCYLGSNKEKWWWTDFVQPDKSIFIDGLQDFEWVSSWDEIEFNAFSEYANKRYYIDTHCAFSNSTNGVIIFKFHYTGKMEFFVKCED